MKRKLLTLCLLGFTVTQSMASETACQERIAADSYYNAPIAARGSTTLKLLSVPLQCIHQTDEWFDSADRRAFACLLGVSIAALPFWAVGVGPVIGAAGLLGFHEVLDHEYKKAKTQLNINKIIYNVFSGKGLTSKEYSFLKRRVFGRYYLTKAQAIDFIKQYEYSNTLCDAPIEYKKVLRLTPEGLKYIKARGYETAMSLILTDEPDQELIDYVERNYLIQEVTPYGGVINLKGLRTLGKEFVKAESLKKIY